MTLFSTGNLSINSTSDAGFKLDVNGTVRISSSLNLTGNLVGAFYSSTGGFSSIAANYDTGITAVTVNYNGFGVTRAFNPTSGVTTYNGFNFAATINQTGGANGITRGIYINPTLTAAADWRAIETTVGNVLLNTTSGNTLIGTSTNSGFKLDVNGTARVSGNATITGNTKIGTNSFTDTSSNLIVGLVNGANPARLAVANASNYQDVMFVNTSISTGNINNWSFGQRQDTFFGNALGSFQIVGAHITNTGTISTVGGGYRVPLICNPDGTIILSGAANSINGNILVGTTTNVASGAFQISSTTKGFLPPRMTTTQKNAIATPAAGLVVYDTTLNKLCLYTTTWETITSI
jgi:hypothetical protein